MVLDMLAGGESELLVHSFVPGEMALGLVSLLDSLHLQWFGLFLCYFDFA